LQTIFITGAAGFIGSNLADRHLADGGNVVGWDNFSTGQEPFLQGALKNPRFQLARGDNLDLDALTAAMKGCDTVFHLAANADVRFGLQHPKKDLEQNTIATFNVLEAMQTNGIKTIAFAPPVRSMARPRSSRLGGPSLPGADLALRRVETWARPHPCLP
jgi:UDP-glucose 4-epimerase